MPVKSRTEFFSKNLFLLLVVASLGIHVLVIFMSPQVNQLLSLRLLRDSFIREPSEYAVTLEVDNPDTQIENPADVASKKEKEEKAEKKKYKIFTDTSDNAEDEETPVDTDKIGAKGAVAKDNFPDDKRPINNEPHAEGHSTAPLLGKGKAGVPYDRQQQPSGQEATAQAFVSEDSAHDENVPPRYANLPKGLEKQEHAAKPFQMIHPQVTAEEGKESTAAVKTVNLGETIQKKDTTAVSKREKLTIGRSIHQEEAEPLPNSEGVFFADKRDEINKKAETEESLSSSLQEEETAKETEMKERELGRTKETKNAPTLQPEIPPVPPSELSGVEPQRKLEKGLDNQESSGELKKPKISINVNAKTEGANNDPVLFEDTISNASIPGAPSFNVKKHEYADYFKHIRDRISLYWFLGYGTRAEIKLETKNDKPVIIEFKVLPNGSIDGVKIVDDAGNFNLASRLVSSIKNAEPLNPFPVNIKEPSIDVRFNFYFF
ncbi:MAG: hypothetical protein HRU72_13405 [Planctomycetia bacterium]|uniref:TonB C-terminal domain-containing protein n=1 Tax=Candidatus Brocadia sapporoensis TaxID=392547 RepID=A0A1V6M0U8_9BACT|nr:energy transducer TonB [Candidatus Brocadia sapporoensis]MCC7238886.1 hypothetical protein [Candidatus Brocadia sp.]QOJ07468.1 MAG: hypothetical protein HRU72_13405 [Planctomycetia bacterium]TVL97552.1 MAG: hypothetical protein CV082_03700 [Candidatus Brocadia sp. BL1]OQD46032.1 hypothetical protein BIY37_05345 [Candidatus Brocadia sapporoensis]GJQ23046.1 MAG: hypothetical protein HBSAPP01_08360 [Candidatus Brocadia sapporoensis]